MMKLHVRLWLLENAWTGVAQESSNCTIDEDPEEKKTEATQNFQHLDWYTWWDFWKIM